VLAFLRAPVIDAELAAGTRPSSSAIHRLRADHLRRPRTRRRIADALNRAVADAHRPTPKGCLQVPLSGFAIDRCHRELRALATSISTLENPRTQGVAIAFQLAFDGSGPLFRQPGGRDGHECLANTIESANAALRISVEFDDLG
jgi:hypothetical protein